MSTITDNEAPHYHDDVAVSIEPIAKAKVPSRPGSQWATGQRKSQKGYTAPKGFARGALTKRFN